MVSELVYRAGMSLHRKSRSGLSIQFGRWERWECFCLSAFSFFFSFLLLRSSLISTMVRPTGASTSHVPISELCWRVFTGRGHDDVMSIGFARCITRLLIRWKSTMPIQIWSWLNSVSVSGTAASPTHLRPPRAFPSSSLHLVRVPADIGTGAVVLKDFQLVVHFLFVVPWNFLSSFYGAAMDLLSSWLLLNHAQEGCTPSSYISSDSYWLVATPRLHSTVQQEFRLLNRHVWRNSIYISPFFPTFFFFITIAHPATIQLLYPSHSISPPVRVLERASQVWPALVLLVAAACMYTHFS